MRVRLDFLSKYLVLQRDGKRPAPSDLESYKGPQSGTPLAGVGIPVDVFFKAVESRDPEPPFSPLLLSVAERICAAIAEDDIVWLKLPFGNSASDYLRTITFIRHIPGSL